MIQKFSILSITSFLRTAGIEEAYSKYYSDIPKETFYQLVAADPSLRHKDETGIPKKIGTYGQWILRMFQQSKLKLEDLYKVSEDLQTLIKVAPVLKQQNKFVDINKFKSPQDLYQFVKENSGRVAPDNKQVPNNQELLLSETYFLDNKEAEVIYEDEKFKIISPKTLAASQFYAEGTRWCTYYPDNFERYSKQGTLFILINKNDLERLQFHFESQQFMDESDDEIDITYFFNKNPKVSSFFKFKFINMGYFLDFKAKHRDEKGMLALKVDNVSDLLDDASKKERSDVDELMSGKRDWYSNIRFRDISSYVEITPQNLLKIQKYLEKTYAAELADRELDLTNSEEVMDFVSEMDDFDVQSAIAQAYKDAERDAANSEISEQIKNALTDNFGINFSGWYPGYNVKIPFDEIEDNWFKLISLDLQNLDAEDFLRRYSSDGLIPYGHIENAIDRASDLSTVDDEDFNSILSQRLHDLK